MDRLHLISVFVAVVDANGFAIAVSGFGLTRLLSYQVADQLRDGRLKIVLSEFEPAAVPVHAVHREGRYTAQKARASLGLAIECLRADPALQ